MIRFAISGQHGSTLLVSLMLLIIMTLIAVSAINLSTVNLRIVNNMQSQYTAEQAAQAAIEEYISSSSIFYSPAATTIEPPGTGLIIQVDEPVCLRSKSATGYSAKISSSAAKITPEDTTWHITGRIVDSSGNIGDPITGAEVEINQGVSVRMRAGNCP